MDWKSLGQGFAKIAPWLAGTFGTPANGVAVKALCGVFGLDEQNATPERVGDAIKAATPEQLLALKQADIAHAEFMAKLGYQSLADLRRAVVDDRNGARHREETLRDKTPARLAALAVVGFVLSVLAVAFGPEIPTAMQAGFWMLIGAQVVVYKDVYAYYFGSSSGSKGKDATIANMAGGAGNV